MPKLLPDEVLNLIAWIEYRYADPNLNHEDFRVDAYLLALDAKAALPGYFPLPTGTTGPVQETPVATSTEDVAVKAAPEM